MTKQPNILFILADDMRYDMIRALGLNHQIQTPNLDQLVQRGLVYTNAHIPGGTLAAVCMPSRAMIQTGRNIFHLCDQGACVPASHALLGQTLREAGYETFATGKWHNGVDSFARSFTSGDEIFFGGMYDHWKVPTNHFDPTGRYASRWYEVMDPCYTHHKSERIADHVSFGVHSTDLFSDTAVRFLREYSQPQPFFLFLAYMAPHDPRSLPQRYLDLYDPQEIDLPPNFLPQHPFDYGINIVRDEILCKTPRDPAEIRQEIRDYYAMISHVDDGVGRVLQALKESGHGDDTIILFASDNGLAVGQHGLLGKQSCYEHSIRVPLVLAGPGIPRCQKREACVYLMDLYPTLCDLLGIRIPDTVQGISFYPTIQDAGSCTRHEIFSLFGDKARSIKDSRYKLIEYKYADLRKTQLFDLRQDPWEQRDLSSQKDAWPIIYRMRERLRATAQAWGDFDSPEGQRFWNEYLRVELEPEG